MTVSEFVSVFDNDIFYIFDENEKVLDKKTSTHINKSEYSEYVVIKANRRNTSMKLIVKGEQSYVQQCLC